MTPTDAKQSVYDKCAGPEGLLLVTPPIFWLGVIPLIAMDLDPGPTDASKSLQQALITNALRKQTLTPGKTEDERHRGQAYTIDKIKMRSR